MRSMIGRRYFMAVDFFHDEFDDRFEDEWEDQGRRNKNARKKLELNKKRIGTSKRQIRLPKLSVPASFEWYDCVMIPVLILGAIGIIFNFPEVSFFFFKLTIWTIDIVFVLVVIAAILLLISLAFRRRRRYYY